MDIYGNINLQGTVPITEGSGLSGELAVIILNDSKESIYELYTSIYNILQNYDRVILINTEEDRIERKLLYSLMVGHRNYDIYETEVKNIDSEYIEKVVSRVNTETDVRNYLGNKIDENISLVGYLEKIAKLAKDKDIELLIDVLNSGKGISSRSIEFIEFLDGFILELVEKINSKNSELDNKTTLINKLSLDISDKIEEINSMGCCIKEKDAEILELQHNIERKEKEIEEANTNSDTECIDTEIIEEHNKIIEELKNSLEEKEREVEKNKESLDALFSEKDRYIEELANLKKEVSRLETVISDIEAKEVDGVEIEELKESYEKLKGKCSEYRSEIASLRASNDSFIDKLRNKAAGAMEFNPLQINNKSKIKSRNILYFKEISYVTYTNTMLLKILELLLKKKQKVKMVIFDKPDEFSSSYRGLTIVNGDYERKKADVLKKDVVVIMEPNMAILEDILSEEYTLVMIVDRLKCVKDLVIGNQVHKFWMVNSSSGIQSILDNANLENQVYSSNIITRPGVGHDTIGISKIVDYNTFTEQAKTSKWYHLVNINSISKGEKSLVIGIILSKCGINIKSRNKGV